LLKLKQINVSQAARIIGKFGGARALSRALKRAGFHRDPSAIYRWCYPKNKSGRGGIVPLQALNEIKMAARLEGIILSEIDFCAVDTVIQKRENVESEE